jgi:hypothetical protein
MVRVGQGCANLMDSYMKNLKGKNYQVDEIWCYVGKKQRYLKETDNID